jgi:hypothetical protein
VWSRTLLPAHSNVGVERGTYTEAEMDTHVFGSCRPPSSFYLCPSPPCHISPT